MAPRDTDRTAEILYHLTKEVERHDNWIESQGRKLITRLAVIEVRVTLLGLGASIVGTFLANWLLKKLTMGP